MDDLEIHTNYDDDEGVDVLYVNVGEPRSGLGAEVRGRVVVHTPPDDESLVIGATVIGISRELGMNSAEVMKRKGEIATAIITRLVNRSPFGFDDDYVFPWDDVRRELGLT
ncbi:hypothetical protein K8I61_13360 [bacterium]|nr:hypothetical protein [bacterium]